MRMIENLAFKGGGVLGTAYVGAFEALEEIRLVGHNGELADWDKDHKWPAKLTVYGNVSRVAGTSAGAIFSTLVALGHNHASIAEIMSKIDFTVFVDHEGVDFLKDLGWCWGNKFLDWMRGQVKDVLGDPNATFANLADRAKKALPLLYKDLHVFSRQVTSGRTVEFCAQNTPDVPIAEAVRASMSIPFFFVPWKFSGDLEKQYPGTFVDGGTAYNYPVSVFDSGEADEKTLGLFLANVSFETQDLLQTAMHVVLKTLNVSNVVAAVAESAFVLIRQLNLSPQEARKQLELHKANLAAQKHANAADNLAWDLAIGAAIGLLAGLAWYDRKSIKEFLEDLYNELKDALGPVIDDLIAAVDAFLVPFGKWLALIGTIVNSPTNMVFGRDASRSIFVNTLGYSFADFWIPECNKQKLLESGRQCAREYLSLMMYT